MRGCPLHCWSLPAPKELRPFSSLAWELRPKTWLLVPLSPLNLFCGESAEAYDLFRAKLTVIEWVAFWHYICAPKLDAPVRNFCAYVICKQAIYRYAPMSQSPACHGWVHSTHCPARPEHLVSASSWVKRVLSGWTSSSALLQPLSAIGYFSWILPSLRNLPCFLHLAPLSLGKVLSMSNISFNYTLRHFFFFYFPFTQRRIYIYKTTLCIISLLLVPTNNKRGKAQNGDWNWLLM